MPSTCSPETTWPSHSHANDAVPLQLPIVAYLLGTDVQTLRAEYHKSAWLWTLKMLSAMNPTLHTVITCNQVQVSVHKQRVQNRLQLELVQVQRILNPRLELDERITNTLGLHGF